MRKYSTWDLPQASAAKPEVVALRHTWLPLALGDQASAYADISDSLLLGMFPQYLNYGPHLDEYKTYLVALLDVLDAHGEEGNPADTAWFEEFQHAFAETYCPYGADASYTRYPPMREQFQKFALSAYIRLPRQYKWYGSTPVAKMEIKFLADEFNRMFDDERMIACMQLVTGLILLQYAYISNLVHFSVNDNSAHVPFADARMLIRSHNAFCEKYGLPTLSWANDAFINNIP